MNPFDSRGRLASTRVESGTGQVATRTDLVYEAGTDRLHSRTVTATAGGPGERVSYGHGDRGNVTSGSYGLFDGTSTSTTWSVARSFDGRCRRKSLRSPDGFRQPRRRIAGLPASGPRVSPCRRAPRPGPSPTGPASAGSS